MKVEVDVAGKDIEALAHKELEKAGLDPNEFKLHYNQAMRRGERGDGDVNYVRFHFTRKVNCGIK